MNTTNVAFIFHPLNLSTAAMMFRIPAGMMKYINNNLVKYLLTKKKPFVLTRINGLTSKMGKKINLSLVVCPLLPEQLALMREEFVLDKIVKTVELAKKRGASLVVLAGFTSVVGNQGIEVAKRVDVPVTTGNTYTALMALEGIEKASRTLGVDLSQANCAVIGATGDIGSASARYLNGRVGVLSLVARDSEKLIELRTELSNKAKTVVRSYNKTKDAVVDADIILTATSSLMTLIENDWLKPGAIVCDVSLPPNVARELSKTRTDLLVFEGGLSKIPSHDRIANSSVGYWWSRNALYGCLAEGMILGFENRLENYSLGRGNITNQQLNEIKEMSQRHGFELSDFFCGDKTYTRSDIAAIRQNTEKNSRRLIA